MSNPHPTRRSVLRWAAALGLVTVTGCPPSFGDGGGVIVFKRSGRGLRISNAAKKHNANRLYKTMAAAAADLPHPGDTSQVVQVTLSASLAAQLFTPGKLIVDLRRDL